MNNEVLSHILGKKVYVVKPEHIHWSTYTRPNDLVYEELNELQYCINIYELADRCIEKAKAQSYQISAYQPIIQDDTGAQVINYWYKGYIVRFDIGSHEPPYQIFGFDCNVKSAPEAIFKAYAWLLEKGKIK
jgi:hypothetical protein